MKNRYLKRCLCISLVSAMVSSAAMPAIAEEELGYQGESLGDELTDTPIDIPPEPVITETPVIEPEPVVTEAPEPTQEPAPEPVNTPEPVITPEPIVTEDPVITPEPEQQPEETITPVPEQDDSQPGVDGEAALIPEADPDTVLIPDGSLTPTPSLLPAEESELTDSPQLTDRVQSIIDRISELAGREVTISDKDAVQKIRSDYDALTEEEKAMVTNYEAFLEIEKKMKDLVAQTEALTSNPVYYTNMVSNLHAGKDFYLNSLKEHYQLVFSDNFAKVMDQIELEYKEKNGLLKEEELKEQKEELESEKVVVTTSADTLLVRNWQDILAIYVYQQTKAGKKEFHLDETCKDELAEIFEEMNPIVREKKETPAAVPADDAALLSTGDEASDVQEEPEEKISYANRHINYYIRVNKLSDEDKEILKKYVETDCELLCAVITGSKGFIRESVGDTVSEERVNVLAAAFSIIGKVGYFWGGKSLYLGVDPSWGKAEKVTSEGSKSTGTIRAFGLDCSGFVTWAVINGYQNQGMLGAVGTGTSEQWELANVVSEQDAQPGDLVFQRGPEAGSDNHVGILCGKTDAGDWIAVHCSSSKNGVTVGEAYGASFRYIRQPSFYPTKEEMEAMANGTFLTSGNSSEGIFLTGDLHSMIISYGSGSGSLIPITRGTSGRTDNISSPEYTVEEETVLIDDSVVTPF